ncbi:MAG: DUF4215 domain-containing protein [Polyangiaceae bacterium]
MTPRCWLIVGVAAVGAAQLAACSSQFESCNDTRTCATSAAGNGQGEAGAAASAGSAGKSASGDAGAAGRQDDVGAGGDLSGVGSVGGDGGGAGAAATQPKLFGACDATGKTVCEGAASAERLSCDGSKWQPGATCPVGALCDTSSGACAKIIPECATVTPGDSACRGDKLFSCGPDLVTTDAGMTCDGACANGACQAPACGDQKVEAGEECDDPVATASGACVKCKTTTVCGDGAVYVGHEECDDGNTAAGDGCSPTCHWEAVDVVAGGTSTCALSAGGQVKCWGDNIQGALGQGDTADRGVLPGELGDALKPILLGTNRTATSISVGVNAACAVLDDGSLKCWGANPFGQLGAGYTSGQGDDPNEMGDHLAAIALGTGRSATSVSEGGYHTCAVLDDGEVKCWGSGSSGQLGQDSSVDVASPASLPGVALGLKASTVSAGTNNTTCALSVDGAGKCWGYWGDGALSVSGFDSLGGDKYAVGDYSGEMAILPPLNIGTRIQALGAGALSSCALLVDGNVKCWGRIALGQGDIEPHGTAPADLPSVPPVLLGRGRTARSISVGEFHVCVVLDDGGVKCWGNNASGQLAVGSTKTIGDGSDEVGDAPGEMGDNLAEIPLGKKALKVSAGRQHTCALLEDASVVCWGLNHKGQLGLGNTDPVGNAPGFMLKAVDLKF